MRQALTFSLVAHLAGSVAAATAQSAPKAGGQPENPPVVNSMELGVFMRQAAYKDQGASPLVYAGYGWAAVLSFARQTPQARVELGASASGVGLSSGVSLQSSALSFEGGLSASYLRTLASGRQRWLAGPAVRLRANARVHKYPDPDQSEELFGFGLASLAVSLRSEHHTRRLGIWSQETSLPLGHFGYWPYGTSKSIFTRASSARWFHPGALRGVEETVSFQRAGRGRLGLRWTYQFSYLHADDVMRRRFAQHTVGGALSVQLGGRR